MKYAPILLLSCFLLAACSREESVAVEPSPAVTPAETAVSSMTNKPDADWIKHGLTDAEGRYSPLADINTDNVGNLGLAWYFDYPTNRGMESTPLSRDGVIYSTGSWSMVFAHDATSGELLWFYDPEVPRDWAVHTCCDVVNRGVALDGANLVFGTLDGRLISLEAATGKKRWEIQTTDTKLPYSITGATASVRCLVAPSQFFSPRLIYLRFAKSEPAGFWYRRNPNSGTIASR